VDPRTFLPAPELPLASVPGPGDPAPDLPTELQPDRAAIVAFLRHTGCPFAEATMRMLRDAGAAAPEIDWIAVSHAPDPDTRRWCETVGGSGSVRVLSDPSRAAYAAWGLGRTSLSHFLGRRSLTAVAEQARAGIRNSHPSGTRWQSAGTFALDAQHVVRWRQIPEHAGDLPDLQAAVASIG
jgi:AhpC/TSA antioxidant enzyme